MALIKTPASFHDESPMGYLLRLANANGMDSIAALTSLAMERTEYVTTVGWDFSLLNRILGASRVPERFGYRPRTYIRGNMALNGQPISARHLGVVKARICPQCLADFGYVPIEWDLKAYVACSIHHTMMLKVCPGCQTRIKVRRSGLLACNCGFDFRRAVPEPAPAELIAVCEILRKKVRGDGSSVRTAVEKRLPVVPLLAMDLDVLCKVLVGIAGQVCYMEHGLAQRRKPTEVAAKLPDVGRILGNWPEQFIEFCAAWRSHYTARPKWSVSFQVCFGWLFAWLHKNLGKARRQTTFLLEAALQYGLRNWEYKPIHLNDRALKRLDLPLPRYGNFAKASAALGLPKYTLIRWLRRGKLPQTAFSPTSEARKWNVDLEALAQLHISAFPGLAVRDAARRLGIPVRVYQEFRRRNVIESQHLTDFDSCAAVEDLDAYASSVLARALPAPPRMCLFPLADYLAAPVPPEQKAALIESIRAGRVTAYLRRKRSIGALLLADDQLSIARAAIRTKREKNIVTYVAVRRYGLGFYEARAMLIHISRRASAVDRPWADVKKVEQFLGRYVPFRVVAKKERLDARRLMNFLKLHRAPSLVLRLASMSKTRGEAHCVFFVAKRNLAAVSRIASIARNAPRS